MKIGIDFDDVVADSGIAIIEMYNKKHGKDFKKKDFYVYRFEEIWGITKEERGRELDEFFAEDQLKKINPMAGVLQGIRDLKEKGHELYIITGRDNKNVKETELWIETHFPKLFSGLHFSSVSRTEEIPQKKSEVCERLGIDIFIDDVLPQILDVAPLGIRIFLFDQPWNQTDELPSNVTRVFSWDEIVKSI